MYHWLALLIEDIKNTSFLTWICVLTGIAEVLLAKKNNVWLYPAGIISTAVAIYILLDVKLYAESALNLYYLFMSIYGWLHWLRNKNQPQLPISKCTRGDWGITIGIIAGAGILMFVILQSYFHRYDNDYIAVWDCGVSATAWAGMWLLARRKIENWVVLNVSNLFAIPLMFYKKLPMFGCLTIFLFIVAIFGYFEWKKLYYTQKRAAA